MCHFYTLSETLDIFSCILQKIAARKVYCNSSIVHSIFALVQVHSRYLRHQVSTGHNRPLSLSAALTTSIILYAN